MVYYKSDTGDAAAVFGALSDSTRLAIVMHLASTDATINEIAEPFGMTLQAVSKHIRVLERAGLVQRQKIGRSNHCKLNHKALEGANKKLTEIEKVWNSRLDRLGEFLESMHSPH